MKNFMSGFIIQSDDGVCTIETRAVQMCELMRGEQTERCALNELPLPIVCNANPTYYKKLVPVGTVEYCRIWMACIGMVEPQPIDYPSSLFPFLGRSVQLFDSYADVPDGIFVKPFRTKAWETHVKRGHANFSGRVWGCGLLGEIIAEWRVYVLNGAIVGVGRYDEADGECEFDMEYAKTVVARYVNSGDTPVAFGVDVGLLTDGSFAVIEVNDAWALGLYKCDVLSMAHCVYRDMLAARWCELAGVKPVLSAIDSRRRVE